MRGREGGFCFCSEVKRHHVAEYKALHRRQCWCVHLIGSEDQEGGKPVGRKAPSACTRAGQVLEHWLAERGSPWSAARRGRALLNAPTIQFHLQIAN